MSEIKKNKILVVDPEKEQQRFLETLLTSRDFEVFLADGEASVESALKKNLPDLMIVDALMPGEGALNLFLALESRPEYRHIQMIFMSPIPLTSLYFYHKITGPRNETGEPILPLVSHIQKPIQEDELLEVIRECLKKQSCPTGDRGNHVH